MSLNKVIVSMGVSKLCFKNQLMLRSFGMSKVKIKSKLSNLVNCDLNVLLFCSGWSIVLVE